MNEIQYIRTKLGVTQQALASMLGTSRSVIAMVENEQRMLPVSACVKLARIQIALQEQQQGYIPAGEEKNIAIEYDQFLREEVEKANSKILPLLERFREEVLEMETRHAQYTQALESIAHQQQHETSMEPEFVLFLAADREELMEKWAKTRPVLQQQLRYRIERLELEYRQNEELLAMIDLQAHYQNEISEAGRLGE